MQTKLISKDETYWKVLNCALDLEIKKGHLKWSLSDLSRKSQITRSLIYYYFGRSKLALLEEAVSIIGQELIGVGDERMEMWRQGQLLESLLAARKIAEEAPNICVFYITYRDRNNSLGLRLKKLEKDFYQKMRSFKPEISRELSNTLFALYFGIIFSPNVGPKEIECFVHLVANLVV